MKRTDASDWSMMAHHDRPATLRDVASAAGVHPATAVGTDLLYASVTKTAGTLVHGLNHTVQWRIVALLAAGSVPATA